MIISIFWCGVNTILIVGGGGGVAYTLYKAKIITRIEKKDRNDHEIQQMSIFWCGVNTILIVVGGGRCCMDKSNAFVSHDIRESVSAAKMFGK